MGVLWAKARHRTGTTVVGSVLVPKFGYADSNLGLMLGNMAKAESANVGERGRQVNDSANEGERPRTNPDAQ